MSLDCGRKKGTVEEWADIQVCKGLGRAVDLESGPSWCEATVVTAAPPCTWRDEPEPWLWTEVQTKLSQDTDVFSSSSFELQMSKNQQSPHLASHLLITSLYFQSNNSQLHFHQHQVFMFSCADKKRFLSATSWASDDGVVYKSVYNPESVHFLAVSVDMHTEPKLQKWSLSKNLLIRCERASADIKAAAWHMHAAVYRSTGVI